MAHRKRFVRGVRRLSMWISVDFISTTMTSSGGTLIQQLNAAALALRPFTVVRSHFLLDVRSDQAASSEIQAGAFGLAVVSNQAAGAGVTALPTPVTDLGSDLWFVHQPFFGSQTTLANVALDARQYQIDSKAMRKVDDDEDIVIMGEFSNLGSGVTLRTAGRLLVKLN